MNRCVSKSWLFCFGSLFILCWFLVTTTVRGQGLIPQTGSSNPLDDINNGPPGASPSLADLDGDGDLDLVITTVTGIIRYYTNTGVSPSSGQTLYVLATSPIGPPSEGSSQNLKFSFGDIDGDGDLDALTGNLNGIITPYINAGTRTNPLFTPLTRTNPLFTPLGTKRPITSAKARSSSVPNPFDAFAYPNEGYIYVSFADFDGDGDLDVLAVSRTVIHYLRNTGSPESPVYQELFGCDNPFNNIVRTGTFSNPSVGDLDGDGDLDVVLSGSPVLYFRNIGTVNNPVFIQIVGEGNPFNGLNFGFGTQLTLGDMDNDGDLEAIYGDLSGELNYLKNVLELSQQPTPANQVTCAGGSVSTTVQASGEGTLSYQWYRYSPTTNTPVPGQTSATLNLTNVQPEDAGLYYVRITAGGGSIFSDGYNLVVQTLSISQQPASASTVAAGTDVIVPAAISGPVTSYQWYFNGEILEGQTSPALTLLNVNASNAGSYYLVASSSCNNVTTSTFTLTVQSGASVSGTKTVAGNFSPGGTVTYTIGLSNTGQATQNNNSGDEFIDNLPGSLYVVSASSTSGNTSINPYTNSVSWNGSIPTSSQVSISIVAMIKNVPSGQVISNRGSISFDSDNNGSNETIVPTDDPGGEGSADSTSFVVSCPEMSPPVLTASSLSTVNEPITVTASGCPGGIINWYPQGGTGTPNGPTYTFSQPGTYTLTAVCTVYGCTSSPSAPVALTILSNNFAISTVTSVNCELFDEVKGGYLVTFTPLYTGQNSNPISFSVVNEKLVTSDPPPYRIRLYTDNPTITLVANQAGSAETRFRFDWWAACPSGSTANRPPTTTGIPNQTIQLGQPYQLDLKNYFSDPDQQPLQFSAQNLPDGLTLTGSLITGTPTTSGGSTVTITAKDPGDLTVNTSFDLSVTSSETPGTSGFTITGVSTVSCEVISSSQRRVTFTPQYAGFTSDPISFSVVNERQPTTDPGPYTMNLFTDNPVITLSAKQGSTVATYAYNWLAGCTPSSRVGVTDTGKGLQVRILGNPVEGKSGEIEITGVAGQSVQVELLDQQGRVLMQNRIEKAGQSERMSVPVGNGKGTMLLQVVTPTQRQQIKLLKP